MRKLILGILFVPTFSFGAVHVQQGDPYLTVGSMTINGVTTINNLDLTNSAGFFHLNNNYLGLSDNVFYFDQQGSMKAYLDYENGTPSLKLGGLALGNPTLTLNLGTQNASFSKGLSVGSMTVTGAGAGNTQLTEGADNTVFPSQIGVDNFWASISSHALVGTFNGSASTYTFVISSVTPVAGQCGQWVATGPNAWTLGNIPCTGIGFLASTQTWTGINAWQSGSFYSSSSTYSGISMVLLSTGVLLIANDFSNFNANVTIASSMSVTASTTTAYEATFSTTSTFYHMAISTNGYVITQGPAPTVSSCGGGTPTVLPGSTSTNGFVTTGTGIFSSCTLTFAAPWPNKPSCVIEDDTTVLTAPPKVTTTTTTMIVSGVTITAGDVLNWICFGN